MNISVFNNRSNVVHLQRPQDTIRIVRTSENIVKRGEREESKRNHQIWTIGASDRWRGTSCSCPHGLKGKQIW